MQTTSKGSYLQAFRHITAGSGLGLRGFYRGLVPAVEQRIVARGPMFLISELCTQMVERHTSLRETKARWSGSIISGYLVGVLAGLAEYRKKMLSQSIVTAKEARWGAIVKSAMDSGHGGSLVRRLHAAGLCAAVYDSTFFGTQDHLANHKSWSAPTSFGAAAVAATVAAFAFDTGVARMMIVAPNQPVPSLLRVVRNVAMENVKQVDFAGWVAAIRTPYRGLPARAVEFAISYSVTGAVSVYVVRWFTTIFGQDDDDES